MVATSCNYCLCYLRIYLVVFSVLQHLFNKVAISNLPVEITSVVSTLPAQLLTDILSLILKLTTFKHCAIHQFIDLNWESMKEEKRNYFQPSEARDARVWSAGREIINHIYEKIPPDRKYPTAKELRNPIQLWKNIQLFTFLTATPLPSCPLHILVYFYFPHHLPFAILRMR